MCATTTTMKKKPKFNQTFTRARFSFLYTIKKDDTQKENEENLRLYIHVWKLIQLFRLSFLFKKNQTFYSLIKKCVNMQIFTDVISAAWGSFETNYKRKIKSFVCKA